MELPWHLMQSARMPGMVGEIPSYRERGNQSNWSVWAFVESLHSSDGITFGIFWALPLIFARTGKKFGLVEWVCGIVALSEPRNLSKSCQRSTHDCCCKEAYSSLQLGTDLGISCFSVLEMQFF